MVIKSTQIWTVQEQTPGLATYLLTKRTKNCANRNNESHIEPDIRIGSIQHRLGFNVN